MFNVSYYRTTDIHCQSNIPHNNWIAQQYPKSCVKLYRQNTLQQQNKIRDLMSYVTFTLIQLPLWVSLSDFSISIFEGIFFFHVVLVLPLQSDYFTDIFLIPLRLHHKLCWTPVPTPCTMSNSAFTISYNTPLTSSLSIFQVFSEFQFLFPGLLVLISSLCQIKLFLVFLGYSWRDH